MRKIFYYALLVVPWLVLFILLVPVVVVTIVSRVCYRKDEDMDTNNRCNLKWALKVYHNFLKNRCRHFFNSSSGSLDRELNQDEDLVSTDGKVIPKSLFIPLGNYQLIIPVLAIVWGLDGIWHISTTCLEDYTCFNQSYLMAESILSCEEMDESDLVLCFKAALNYERMVSNIGGVTFTSYLVLLLTSFIAKCFGQFYRVVRYIFFNLSAITFLLLVASLIKSWTGWMHEYLWYIKLTSYVFFIPMSSLIPWEILYISEHMEVNSDPQQQHGSSPNGSSKAQGNDIVDEAQSSSQQDAPQRIVSHGRGTNIAGNNLETNTAMMQQNIEEEVESPDGCETSSL